jgi:hypothetical protein
MSDAPDTPDLVEVPIPRPLAWLVGRIGWSGVLAVAAVAWVSGWADTLFVAVGLPPLVGAPAEGEVEGCDDLADAVGELRAEVRAEVEHARAMRAAELAMLGRVEAECRGVND